MTAGKMFFLQISLRTVRHSMAIDFEKPSANSNGRQSLQFLGKEARGRRRGSHSVNRITYLRVVMRYL